MCVYACLINKCQTWYNFINIQTDTRKRIIYKEIRMGSPKKSFVVDPDYEMSEIVRERVRLREERG